MVEAWEAVVSIYFPRAVDRSFVETFGLFGGVLDLETGFYVFDGGGYEAYCCAGLGGWWR